MSRTMRIVLGLAAALLFLCCVAALGLALLGMRLIPKAVITDPTRIAAVGNQIAHYQLPPGYGELFASDVIGFKMIAIGPSDQKANLLIIMLMQLPTPASVDQEEMQRQMELTLAQQTGLGSADMQVIGTQPATIRGKSITFTVREGKTGDGQLLHQLSGMFEGINGPVVVVVTGDARTWDQSLVDGFFASIQ
jgi:hypothetical protein